MNTEELFEQILGLKEVEIICVSTHADRYEISVRGILAQGICPKCGKKCSQVKSYTTRSIRDLPISDKRVILELEDR